MLSQKVRMRVKTNTKARPSENKSLFNKSITQNIDVESQQRN